MLGALGMPGAFGMLGRMTPGMGMLAAGTPINVRPMGCAAGRGGAPTLAEVEAFLQHAR